MGQRTTSGSFMKVSGKTPGPGQYESTIVSKKTPGGPIGNKTNDGRGGKENPVGPGQYDTRGNIGNKGFGKVPNKGFGTVGHGSLTTNRDKVPGPGAYCSGKEEYDYN